MENYLSEHTQHYAVNPNNEPVVSEVENNYEATTVNHSISRSKKSESEIVR